MKKYLLFGAFAMLVYGFASGATVTIINVGFTFSPDVVSINAGDTVIFQIGSIHTVVEVNEATWNANGNTPLDGGFSLPFGGGQLTGLTPGTHFYVCGPHASGGMKGKIIVNGSSGIGENETGIKMFSIYPNPTSGKFMLQFNGPDGKAGSWIHNDPEAGIQVFNILGEKVADLSSLISSSSNEIDLTSVPDGIYFIRLKDSKSTFTEKLIKR